MREYGECEHEYRFAGSVFSTGDLEKGYADPTRIYEDKFFCIKCLSIVYLLFI